MTSPLVAVLGTGTMGAGIVRSLRRAGIGVRMWNRTPEKARALTGTGALAFDSPAEAVRGADVVLTMLFDTDAVVEVITRAAPAPGTVWLQMSTVGIAGAQRTIEVARELGLVLVDAPVLGTKEPAEQGRLVVLASGPEEVRDSLAPVLDAVASTVLWVGPAGAGSRVKLVCNSWLLMVTAGTAQAIALSRGLGVDPQHFMAAIGGGPMDAPYVHVKGALMLRGEYPVSFSLAGATKDARLIREALRAAGVSDRLMAAVIETMEAAAEQVGDPKAVDLAAMVEGL